MEASAWTTSTSSSRSPSCRQVRRTNRTSFDSPAARNSVVRSRLGNAASSGTGGSVASICTSTRGEARRASSRSFSSRGGSRSSGTRSRPSDSGSVPFRVCSTASVSSPATSIRFICRSFAAYRSMSRARSWALSDTRSDARPDGPPDVRRPRVTSAGVSPAARRDSRLCSTRSASR